MRRSWFSPVKNVKSTWRFRSLDTPVGRPIFVCASLLRSEIVGGQCGHDKKSGERSMNAIAYGMLPSRWQSRCASPEKAKTKRNRNLTTVGATLWAAVNNRQATPNHTAISQHHRCGNSTPTDQKGNVCMFVPLSL